MKAGPIGGSRDWAMRMSPQAEVTPDSFIDSTLQDSLNSVQQRFNQQWAAIQKSATFVGAKKANSMLQQLHLTTQDEVAQMKAGSQQRKDMLKRMDKLHAQGALSTQVENPEKLRWEIAAGKDVAEQMFPTLKQPKPTDVMAEYGKLDVLGSRIQSSMKDYELSEAGRGLRPGKPRQVLSIFNAATGEYEKVGERVYKADGSFEVVSGDTDWQEMEARQAAVKTIRSAQDILLQSPGMWNRISRTAAKLTTGGIEGGTIADQVTASAILRNPPEEKAPENVAEFEAEVRRLAATDRKAAKAYYDKWSQKL